VQNSVPILGPPCILDMSFGSAVRCCDQGRDSVRPASQHVEATTD